MTLVDRFALTARIAACVMAGSIAGSLAWAVAALGIGSLVWAAPLLLLVALAFGLPSIGLLLATAMLFARSIRRHPASWCLALPLAAMLGWRRVEPEAAYALHGTMLVALCVATSSALFFLWSRYLPASRVTA